MMVGRKIVGVCRAKVAGSMFARFTPRPTGPMDAYVHAVHDTGRGEVVEGPNTLELFQCWLDSPNHMGRPAWYR